MLAIFAVAGGMAIYLNLRDEEVVLLLPEKHDPTFQMEQRQSQDNAWHLLVEAESMLPEAPDEVREALWEQQRNSYGQYRPFEHEVEDYLGISKADVPSPLRDYMAQCGPVVARMHEALQKPYFLHPEPQHKLTERVQMYFHRLGLVAAGHGVLLTHVPETTRHGMEVLLECMKLGRWLCAEEGEFIAARSIGEYALEALSHTVMRPHAAEHLEWLQQQLQLMGQPFPDRRAVVENYWRVLDNSLTYQPGFDNLIHRLGAMKRMSDVRFLVRGWQPAREKTLEMAAAPMTSANHIMHSHPPTKAVLDDERHKLWMNIALVREACYQQFYHMRTVTLVAMQRFKNVRGAYPLQLEELVPDFLGAMPHDPLCALPLKYTSDGATVIAYGFGEDGADNGLTGNDLTAIKLPMP